MKKTTFLKSILFVIVLLQSTIAISQNLKPFTSRQDFRVKGDMLLIGNNILNRDSYVNGQRPVNSYNGNGYNSNFDMNYIDIDNDPNTFSSSSATLTIPKPACYQIKYAGLYWGAILQSGSRTEINKVKLKLPNATSYTDVVGSVIYDANSTPIGGDSNKAYACYADITTLVTALSDAQGTYTVANVISSQGKNGGTGLSAGWSIYVVYEDPTLPAKFITSFDGFSGIGGATTLDIAVSGFKTIPSGPVRVKFAFAALEGDNPISGDYLQINGSTISAVNNAKQTIRATNNFFNSSVTYINPTTGITENFTDRVPASTNTLGYDAGILNIDNPATKAKPGGSIINNNETSAKITLGSTQDVYFYYFNAFAVDIIEPKIVLTKVVYDEFGKDISNQDVNLDQALNYVIGVQNTGNDDATSLTIRDRLPINTVFNIADLILPSGVSLVSYTPATRDIVLSVANYLVKSESPIITNITIPVRVVPDCASLSEACSNSIDNQAYATYKGTLNPDFELSDDPSVNTNTGCILTPKATNFLVGIDGCKFTENITLCEENVDLKAAGGYSSYSWSTDEAGTNVIGTNQIQNVSQPGVYYVNNYAVAPCRSIKQEFTVTRFGSTTTNPVIPFADEVVNCPNDDKKLPNIYLCGATDEREIKTGITDGSTIVWEKSSCPLLPSTLCADETTACTWTQVGTGANYTPTTAGQYRLSLNYTGGCYNRFFFNVYQNNLNPTETHSDIYCTTPGNITIGDVPTGYEYSLTETGTYTDSNIFTITTAGVYTVYIRQKGVLSSPCIFKVENIRITDRQLSVATTITAPLCKGAKGTVKVAANNVRGQYSFSILNGTTVINSVGPISASDYTFIDLSAGTYNIKVTTTDGCSFTGPITISEPNALTATIGLTTPLTACSDGEVTVYPVGGTAPYFYFVNGSTTFQSVPQIPITTAGKYDVNVVDNNGCEYPVTITVSNNPKPDYTISSKNISCYGVNDGEIKFVVTKTNGYTIRYSKDNGVTFSTNPTFSNLSAGTYTPVIEYTLSGQVCTEVGTAITISGPTSALTASAGVSKLAGCTLSDKGGTLRFTNVEGGTPLYTYSFDGGASFQSLSEKEVLPGTYTLVIKDATGCTYTIPYDIILDPIPTAPTITIDTTDFNCDGTATSTVTVTNSGSSNYQYEYLIDGVINPNTADPKVFLNVPSGSHTITVNYNLVSVSTFSNLLKEDFGSGEDAKITGINAAYCWEKQDNIVDCNPQLSYHPEYLNDGEYVVTKGLLAGHQSGFGWTLPKDNTTIVNGKPVDPNGRFLAVNIGGVVPVGGIIYRKTINDIIPNQDIKVSLYMLNLLLKTNQKPSPNLTIQLLKNGTVVPGASVNTPNITQDELWHSSNELTLNPGNNTTLDFVIISNSTIVDGNDLAVDDISVYQLPESCITKKEFPIVVPTDKQFSASIVGFTNLKCSGVNDGTITIAAQNFNTTYGFDYSIDNGNTWTNSKTSPVTITGLAAQSFPIKIRYDNSASTCSFDFVQDITTPTAVTVSASVTTQPSCTNGATITGVASNGTPGYEYELRKQDGTVVVAFRTSGVFTNVATGTYTVVARDTNKCASSASAIVDVNVPTPPVATLDPTSDLCYDSVNKATLVVSVTGGTGTLSYSLDGGVGQTTNTFTNVDPGTHTIVVTDSNNCTDTISSIVIAKELKANATISKTLDCSITTPNATIDVVITEGAAPYSYTVKKDTGSYGSSVNVTGSSFSYSASASGLYTFLITDANSCTTTTTATVSSIVNPTVDATPTQVTCFGGTDGEVQLVGKGGSGSYTYSFNASGFTTTSVYKNLSAGTAYPYEVKDSKGCIGKGTITLTQPTQLIASASATTFTCNSSNVKQTATVTIAVPTTGTSPYTYSFDNGGTYVSGNTKTYTDNGTDQVIQYAVKDKNGCPASGSLTLKALNTPTDLTFTAAAVTCDVTTTTVTATAVVASGTLVTPLKYEITSPAAAIANNTDGIFAGLTPNTYSFKVTDANGCYYIEAYEILAVTPIAVIGNKVSDVQCNGGNTGAINFTVSGTATVGAYTYTITPALTATTGVATKTGNTVSLTGLVAGTYTVAVKDNATGCTNTADVTIAETTALTTTAIATNVNCNNFNSQITVTATGGKANYSYAAVLTGATAPTTFGTNPVIVDTNSGADLVWDVYTKDANGCTTFRTITIVLDALPTVTAVVSNQCTATGTNFTITATPGGTGVTPFTYSIDGTNFKIGNTFNVAPGTYTVTIKDNNGCTATAAPLVVYATLTTAATTKQLDCTTTPDGSITVTISGGKANYSYTVQKGTAAVSAPVTGVTGPTFTYPVLVANADTYTFVITDANNCTSTVSATIDAITNPTVTADQINVTCNGLANGSVQLTAAAGSGTGYTYSKDGTTYVIDSSFTGLAASATPYTFYVKDSKGCIGTIEVTITQPVVLAVTPSITPFSCSTSNAKETATVSLTADAGTGTAPYRYSFDNGGTFLAANTKTYTDTGVDQVVNYAVIDNNSCITYGTLTLKALNPPTDLTFSAAAVTCTATTTTVTATAVVASGTLVTPLKYEITSPAAAIANNTDGIFAGLTPNTYNFKVTDANGCFYSESFEVKAVTPITISGNKLSDVKCFGDSTGSATYTVGGFATTYSYTVNAGTPITGQTATTINLSSLVAGSYVVVVTDEATGCTATAASITINQPATALTASIISNINANCNVATSKVTISASGGTAAYTYAFVQNNVAPVSANYSTNAVANLNPATNTEWDVWAKDANGCTFKVDVTIASDPVPTVSASAANQCLGSGTYTITATNTTTPAAGIVSPITYSINNGTYQTGNTFTVTAAGNYIIKMKDGNGCIATSNTVTVNPILTLSAKLDKNITCTTPAEAQITLTANGGNGTYTYTATPNTGTFVANVFTTSTPGSYTFTVTDTSASACNATTTTPIVILAAVTPDITGITQTQTIKCNGDTTGAFSVAIDATLGQAPFEYSIDGGTTLQTSNTFTGLAAGTYTVTLLDAKGCTDTMGITIGEPTPIVIDYDVEDIKCVPGSGTISQGSITINSVTGGTANYNYYVTGINGYYKEELNTPGSSVIFDIVDFGLYQIRVTDANGCQVTIDDVKIASAPDDLDINIISTADCVSGGTANVSIGTTLASVGPFHFNIYSGPGQVFTADGSDGWQAESSVGSEETTFTGLLPGVTYTFIVYDSITGCYYFETAATAIPTNSLLTLDNVVENNVKCFSDTYGSVDFDVTNAYTSAVTVTYQVYEAFTNNLITGAGITVPVNIAPGATINVTDLGSTVLTVGTYYVLVKEVTGPNAGCSAVSADFNIKKSPSQLLLTASAIKKSNCNDLGMILAEAKDGTGPYTYQVVAAGTPTVATDWVTTAVFDRAGSLAGIDYDVYAQDAYGCIVNVPVTVLADAEPTIDPVTSICYDGNGFTISIAGTVDPAIVGDATYSINGSAFQTGTDFIFNAAGTYNLVIKDGNGCTATTALIVYPQLDLKAAITKELDCTGSTSDAIITLTTTGGNTSPSANYTYQVSYNGGPTSGASATYTATAAGEYVFTVTDNNNITTCATTVSITVEAIPTPTITPTSTIVSCNGGNDGTITVDVTGGVGPYTYVLTSNPTNTTGDATGIYTGLVAGTTYEVTVRDAKSCDYVSGPITVDQPTALDAAAVVTTELKCGPANAATEAVVTVTVVAGTGTSPYEYSFDGGTNYSSDNTFKTFTAGPVNAIVKDAKGCLFTVPTVTVDALDPPVITAITGTPIYCAPVANTTSTVQISHSNGIGTISYAILEPATATSNTTGATSGVFTGLAVGTYLFEVKDGNNCTAQQYYTVDPVVNITVSGQIIDDVKCVGESNGSVEFTVDNYVGTYSYSINSGPAVVAQSAATITLTGLPAGPQNIVVTDDTSLCTANFLVTVTEPALALSLVATLDKNANCNYGAKVSAIATNGTPGYTYAFALASDPAPAAGDYTTTNTAVLDATLGLDWIAYTKDANNCTAQDLLTLVIDPLPTIDLLANVYCYDGSPITVTITGAGVGPLKYSIGNGYQSSPDFVLTAPKTYDFYVQDANGCIVTEKYTLNQELLLQATLTQDLTCDNNASITFLATQGSLAYTTYEVDIDGAGYTTFTGTPYIASTPGTYKFRVTDNAGCQTVSQEIVVTPKTTPTFTYTQTNVKCIGGNEGAIIVTAADGIEPYSYTINSGTPQTLNIFKNLTAGTYTIEVKDAKGCFPVTQDVIITEPTALAATIDVTTTLSCGTANATQPAIVTVTVDATTGTGPYLYSFDNQLNYADVNTFETFNAGSVTAYVKDANGCVIATAVSVTVDALDPPVITAITGSAIHCAPIANTTSTVTVAYTNGVGPLSFNIIEPTVGTPQTSNVFTGLAAGTYLFQVTDANGCTAQEYYTVDDVVNISVSGQTIKDVSCVTDANGEIEFKVANYNGTYSVALTPNSGTILQTGDTVTVTGLIAGSYSLRVTDNVTACIADATVIVNQPTALTLALVSNVNATCNTDAFVTVEASGGTPVYLYAFVADGVTPATTDYSTVANAVLDKTITNWDVYVKDNNNCETKLDVAIATDPLPAVISIVGLSQCPTATGEYTFTVDVGSGVAPYEYSIGSGFQTSNTFTVTKSGDYDVTVKDANECEVTVPGLVSILAPLDLQAIITALPSCDFNDGIVDATVTGGSGTGNYRFQIDSGVIRNADSFSFTGLAPGLHTVFVRDVVTGCTDTMDVNLEAATIITDLVVTGINVSCNGGNNGTITATIAANAPGVNDNPIYTYELTGTTIGGTPVTVAASPNNVFENLAAGDYTVIVRSGRGCVASDDITLIQPAVIMVPTPVATQFSCATGTNGANFATVTVNGVIGGSSNYVIYEFIKDGTIVQRDLSNVYTEANYAGGSYMVNVYDDNNCIGSSTTAVVIAPYTGLDKINIKVDTAITCTNPETFTATAVDAAGVTIAGIDYTLTDATGTLLQTNTTGIFTSLNVGDYIITAMNSVTGCSIQTVHYINEPNTFELQAVKTSDVVCFGSNEGAVTITLIDTQIVPFDDAGAFTYTVSGPTASTGTTTNAGPLDLTGLTAGLYTVSATLVNTPYCTVSTVFTIDQPVAALTIAETHTKITCITGNNDGSISVTATGGWAGDYQYEVLKDGVELSAYSDVTDYANLTAGVYTLNVKDSKGCVATTTVTLVVPTPIMVTATPSTLLLTCYGDTDATLTATAVSGGQESNYLYTLNIVSETPVVVSGPQTDPIFTNLGAGTYNITVTDGYNCTATSADVVIVAATEVVSQLIVDTTPTCLQTDATLILSATGGTAPYTYSADGVTYSTTPFMSNVSFDVAVGTYQYYVKDTYGCVEFISNSVEVVPVEPLVVNVDTSNAVIFCKGDDSGVIVATATGGLGNYVYTLLDASGTLIPSSAVTQLTPGRFTQLVAGTYQVKVVSDDCEAVSIAVTVTEPDDLLDYTAVVTPITCNGENDGMIVVAGFGGTGEIKYSISPQSDQFFDTGVFDKLAPGVYQVIVQDVLGCFRIHDFTIDQPTILYGTYDPLLIIPEVCSGDRDGAFTIEVAGGTAPYKVSLDDIDGTYTQGVLGQTSFDFNNLIGGTHSVYIKDASGCTSELEVVMPDAVKLNPEATITYDCVNNAQANRVVVTFDESNDPADLDFDLDGLGNWQVSNIFENLTPGTHFIHVRHVDGCIQTTEDFEVNQVDPLGLAISDGDLNQIKAIATGGGGEYEYSFDGEAFTSESTFAIYRSGTYTVIVRDAYGCTVTVSREFTYIDVCIPNYFTPNGDGTLDVWGPGCTNNYPDLTFAIFDRYGREVAKYRIGQKWDGTYKGEELPSGDYWYVLKLNNNKDDREFVGHFTLYR